MQRYHQVFPYVWLPTNAITAKSYVERVTQFLNNKVLCNVKREKCLNFFILRSLLLPCFGMCAVTCVSGEKKLLPFKQLKTDNSSPKCIQRKLNIAGNDITLKQGHCIRFVKKNK